MNGLLFDLGGTYLRAGVLDHDGRIQAVARTRIANVADGLTSDLIWERITDTMLEYEHQHRSRVAEDAPVVISFPGPIGRGRKILQAPTVAGAEDRTFDLPGEVARVTGRRVEVLNDVSAAAWLLAEATSAQRFLVVTVSSGIGSKLFDRCHASGVLDFPPHAGEIGHVVVDDSVDAPLCDCGGRGHLGATASGRGIERIIRREALARPLLFQQSACVQHFGADAENLNNEEHIVPAALHGDAWVAGIVRDCTRPLVRSLLTVAMAVGLEKIFVMGGFANALGSWYLALLRDLASELSRYDVARRNLDELFEGMPVQHETSLEGCAAFLRSGRLRA